MSTDLERELVPFFLRTSSNFFPRGEGEEGGQPVRDFAPTCLHGLQHLL